MGRRRRTDIHLPSCVYHRYGAYWLVKRGKWMRLGGSLREALSEYARRHEPTAGTMPALIVEVLDQIGPNLAVSTRRQYKTAGEKLAKILQQFEPREVKPRHVAAIKVAMSGTPNMGNRCLSLLRQIFDFALEHGRVDSNPAAGVRRHKEAKRGRLIGADEYLAIYEQAGERLQVILDLLRLTGQRVGDVLRIQRADLTEHGIRFRQQKTQARLVVRWTPELRDVVDRARALQGDVKVLSLLANRSRKAPDYRSVALQWTRACDRAGIEDAHLHDLRAVALTAAQQQGLNPTALAGHTSPAMTRRYLRDRTETIVDGPQFSADIGQPARILDKKG